MSLFNGYYRDEAMTERVYNWIRAVELENERLRADNAALMAALKGVIAVADRKTKEFDSAREALSTPHPGAALLERLADYENALKKYADIFYIPFKWLIRRETRDGRICDVATAVLEKHGAKG